MAPLAFVLALSLSIPSAGVLQSLRPDHRIVEQPDAPVLVTSYRTELLKRTAEAPEGMRHDLEFRSRGGHRIVAVQFGLVSFDVWNEFLERHVALSTEAIDPDCRKRGSWFTETSTGVAFLTGVVYVDRVRFADGTIWTANQESIVTAMRGIQKDFSAEMLVVKRK